MHAIEKALLNFAVFNSRLPCPGDLTQNSASSTYGMESANPGSCTGGTPAATYTATSGTIEGSVPTRALQLPEDYIYDGWGHRIRYAVDPNFTAANSLPASVTCNPAAAGDSAAITVYDGAGGTRSSAAAYALISHGANGHGAFTSSYVSSLLNANSTNTNEQTNCHCNGSATPGTYTATYVAQAPAQPLRPNKF